MGNVLNQQAKVFFSLSSFRKAKVAFTKPYRNFDGRNDKASIFRRFIKKLKGKGHQSLPVQLLPDASHHQLDFTKAVFMFKKSEISQMPADEARKLDPTLPFNMRNNNWLHYARPLEMSYYDHGLLKYPMSVDSDAPVMPELPVLKHVRNKLSDAKEDDHQEYNDLVSGSKPKDANGRFFRKKWFLQPPSIVQNPVDLPKWANLERDTEFVYETPFPELRKDATFIVKHLNSKNVQITSKTTQSARKKWFLEPTIVKHQVDLPNWAKAKMNFDTASQMVSDQVPNVGLFIQDPKPTFRARPVPPTTYKPVLPVVMIKGQQSFKSAAQEHQLENTMTKQILKDLQSKPFRARPVPPSTFKPFIPPVVNKVRQSSIKDETKKTNQKRLIAMKEVNLEKSINNTKPIRAITNRLL